MNTCHSLIRISFPSGLVPILIVTTGHGGMHHITCNTSIKGVRYTWHRVTVA